MIESNFKPDFGIMYIENFGEGVIYCNPSFRVFEITHIGNNLFTTESIVNFNEKEYLMTIDFDIKLLMQLLDIKGNLKFKKKLVDSLFNDFKGIVNEKFYDTPLEVTIEAIPGKKISNENEEYIPFVVQSFTSPHLVKLKTKKELSLPDKITHVIMFEDNPNGFAIKARIKKGKSKDPILNCTACYAGMGEMCDSGSMYVYDNLEEAKKSIAWQVMGGFNYAVPVEKLSSEQIKLSEQLWQSYEDDFRYGFSKRGISI